MTPTVDFRETPSTLTRSLSLLFFLDFSERRTLESWTIRVTHLSVEISGLKITTSRLGAGGLEVAGELSSFVAYPKIFVLMPERGHFYSGSAETKTTPSALK